MQKKKHIWLKITQMCDNFLTSYAWVFMKKYFDLDWRHVYLVIWFPTTIVNSARKQYIAYINHGQLTTSLHWACRIACIVSGTSDPLSFNVRSVFPIWNFTPISASNAPPPQYFRVRGFSGRNSPNIKSRSFQNIQLHVDNSQKRPVWYL